MVFFYGITIPLFPTHVNLKTRKIINITNITLTNVYHKNILYILYVYSKEGISTNVGLFYKQGAGCLKFAAERGNIPDDLGNGFAQCGAQRQYGAERGLVFAQEGLYRGCAAIDCANAAPAPS